MSLPQELPRQVEEQVLRDVFAETKVSARDIRSSAKFPHIVHARRLALSRLVGLGYNYSCIARAWGKRPKVVRGCYLDGARR